MAFKEIPYSTHEEWLAIRSEYIGGSDAGAVIGMNPYKSAYTLWAEKTGTLPPFDGSITTQVGAYLEQFVAKMFEDETGKKVRKKNATLVNEQYPFACANLDRIVVGEKAFLEIKTTNSIPIMKALRNDDSFPEAYYAQCVHYLAVTGFEKAYLAVLINCREFKVYEMDRDQAEIDALMGAERDFWHCVQTKTPPAPDGSENTTESITAIYRDSNGSSCSLMAYESSLRDYVALGNQIKELERMKTEIENDIKVYMGESEVGDSAGFKVTWKPSVRNSFDSKAFIADHPREDLSKYIKSSSCRMFRITEVKQK